LHKLKRQDNRADTSGDILIEVRWDTRSLQCFTVCLEYKLLTYQGPAVGKIINNMYIHILWKECFSHFTHLMRSQFVIVQWCQLMFSFPVPIIPISTPSTLKLCFVCACLCLFMCLQTHGCSCVLYGAWPVYSCVSAAVTCLGVQIPIFAQGFIAQSQLILPFELTWQNKFNSLRRIFLLVWVCQVSSLILSLFPH